MNIGTMAIVKLVSRVAAMNSKQIASTGPGGDEIWNVVTGVNYTILTKIILFYVYL